MTRSSIFRNSGRLLMVSAELPGSTYSPTLTVPRARSLAVVTLRWVSIEFPSGSISASVSIWRLDETRR
jgi:hypothetical protein